jgi:hypothetical protein
LDSRAPGLAVVPAFGGDLLCQGAEAAKRTRGAKPCKSVISLLTSGGVDVPRESLNAAETVVSSGTLTRTTRTPRLLGLTNFLDGPGELDRDSSRSLTFWGLRRSSHA